MFKITKTNLENWQYIMLTLLIITLPIISLPKAYQIIGIGGKLYIYPLIAGLILFIIEKIKFRTKLNTKISKYLLLILIVQFVSTFYGLIKFPFYNDINIITNEKFAIIANILNISLEQDITFFKFIFMFIRSIKMVVMEFIPEWLLAFWVFHLFQNDFENGFRKIRSMFIILALLLSIYAVPEILYFKFNIQLGYDILCTLNPYLYDPVTYLNWYPPIVYPNHGLKSYCIEPGFIGLLAATILPFLFNFVFQYKENIMRYIFYTYFVMILFMTKSRGANVIIYLYASLMLFYSKFYESFRKYIIVIVLIGLGFCGAILSKENVFNSIELYFASNIETITSTTARSNGSRLNNILSHLNVVKEHPLLGTGMGLKDLYIEDTISERALKENELKMITDGIRKDGMFKYSYGNVNQYVYILTNYGLIGFCLYFFPVAYLLYKIWKTKVFVNKEIGILVIALLLNLAAMMTGSSFSGIFIIGGLLYTAIFNKNIRSN